jgi:cell division protein FtsW
VSTTAIATDATRLRWRMGVEARALVLVSGALLAFGLAALYSASALLAIQEQRDGSYYLQRQLSGVLVGIVAFAIAAKIDAENWSAWAWPVMLSVLFLVLLTLLPFTESIAPRVHGSRRFLIGSSLQPSELAKLAVVMWTAMLVQKKGAQMRHFRKGTLPILTIIGLLDLLVVLQPDLSQAMFFTLIMGVVLFAGGVRIGHFVLLGLIAVMGTPVLWHKVERLQYVIWRIVSWMPFIEGEAIKAQPLTHQVSQSIIAVGSGGLLGQGFGQGHQQAGFVPFPYSDFIASNVGEEWGFIGIFFLVVAFTVYGWLGYRIARSARSPFLRMVAIGLTFTMVLTAFVHLGVVLGILPTTGLTLPFVSYGRSNLVLSLLMTGILVNIGSEREKVFNESATNPLAVVPA